MASEFEREKSINVLFPLLKPDGTAVNEGELAALMFQISQISELDRVGLEKRVFLAPGDIEKTVPVMLYKANAVESERREIEATMQEFLSTVGWSGIVEE